MGETSLAPSSSETKSYQRLRRLLDELFQLNQADLDFGIYRIMSQKHAEIGRFLDEDLLPQVRQSFTDYRVGDEEEKRVRLREIEREAARFNASPEQNEEYRQIQDELAQTRSVEVLENEVYSDLYTFFRRYYKEGDFLSLRRYKAGVYAIPYEGEEVKLHWANADQYYVKTTEAFQDYRFRLPDGRHVHFRLVAAETERDNNKATTAEERRFVLREAEPVAEIDGELHIRFEYHPSKVKQKDLNAQTVETLLGMAAIRDWRDVLLAPQPTASNGSRSLLEKHLTDYTAKNTFDYFVHKDLGGFLRRELDFFLKNEVAHMDDLDTPDERRANQYLARLRAIKRIGHKIIDFLAQLEDFQKRLFLKKKFVLETNYCLTVDRVPKDLLGEVLANNRQHEEWVRLFGLPNVPVTKETLARNPFLVVDTALFDPGFKQRLIAELDDVDESINGTLVQGDNFQALNLLRARYEGQVSCIYIDPPFNTENEQFLYRDTYRSSTWTTIMRDRLQLGVSYLAEDGTMYVHLDHNSSFLARHLLDELLGQSNFLNEVIWRIGWVSGYKTIAARYVRNHETILTYVKSPRDYYFNKDAARIPYSSFEAATIKDELTEIRAKFGLEGRQDIRLGDLTFLDANDHVYKIGLTQKDGRYNVEDTWNSNVYEELDSNKIKRNAAEYTPNGSLLTQKPEKLLKRVLEVSSRPDDVVMDFFAGSGTTPAVALKLNRRFVAVEMGSYFDSDLLYRLKMVLGGRRVGISSYVDYAGGGCVKYVRLESYEDTLNNLRLRERSAAQQSLLEQLSSAREDYMLSYYLDIETEGSVSLLNLERFEAPFDYQLTVTQGGEGRSVSVDLPETFSYLLGLRVKRIRTRDGFYTVEGADPEGKRVLVIWRGLKDPETDNEALERFYTGQGYADRPAEDAPDRIYVNGDNTLLNLRPEGASWQVLLIEEEFKRLMFADTGEGAF
jgi:adenine-specific DNA-methyltransferase